LDAGGEYAYLSSSDGAFGGSDIVRVKLLEKEMPDPVVLVSGNVYNAKTKEPLSASLVYETQGQTETRVSRSPLDVANGNPSFRLTLKRLPRS
jgi:hypothetical protein